MVTPDSLLEYRLDGHVVPESMTGDQMLDEGWDPSKVIALHWDYFGTSIDLRTAYGFGTEIVPNREYVAILENTDDSGDHSILSVYHANGTLQHTFLNLVQIGEVVEVGEFLWFEEPVSDLPTAFSPVFNVARTGATFQVDFDAASGGILGIHEVR